MFKYSTEKTLEARKENAFNFLRSDSITPKHNNHVWHRPSRPRHRPGQARHEGEVYGRGQEPHQGDEEGGGMHELRPLQTGTVAGRYVIS